MKKWMEKFRLDMKEKETNVSYTLSGEQIEEIFGELERLRAESLRYLQDLNDRTLEIERLEKENEELLIKSLRLEKRDRIEISSRQIGKMRRTIEEFLKSLAIQESVIMVTGKYVIMDNESYRKLNEKIRKLKIDMEFLKGAYDNLSQSH